MSIFITGVESFLGKFLAKTLLERNINFEGIDLIKKNSYTKIYDICNKTLKENIPKNINTIVHLAAIATSNDFKVDPKKSYEVNINGTINLIKSAIHNEIQHIIFASSEWVYGEDKFEKKDEDSIIDFNKLGSEYALSKALCENILQYYCSINNINCTILRFGIIYGPRETKKNWSAVESILFNLYEKKEFITVGSKKTARRFIYVKDVAEGIISSLPLKGINVLNLTGDELVSLEKIVEIGNEILKTKCKINEKDTNNFNLRDAKNDKIKKLTSWKPKFNIRFGAEKILESFKVFY